MQFRNSSKNIIKVPTRRPQSMKEGETRVPIPQEIRERVEKEVEIRVVLRVGVEVDYVERCVGG